MLEVGAGVEEMAVVVEIVDADFETVFGQPGAEFVGYAIGAFGDEVENGRKAEAQFELGQGAAFGEALWTFDVVGEDEGELFAVGPAGPAGGRAGGGFVDGPGGFIQAARPAGE